MLRGSDDFYIPDNLEEELTAFYKRVNPDKSMNVGLERGVDVLDSANPFEVQGVGTSPLSEVAQTVRACVGNHLCVDTTRILGPVKDPLSILPFPK